MPKIEIDYRPNIMSIINTVLVLLGMLGGVAFFYSDVRHDGQKIQAVSRQVEALHQADQTITNKINEGQQMTTNRLSTLEAQNAFIIRSLDRVESAIRGKL